MNNYIILISAIGTYFLAIFIHEIGHYISGFIFKYKPKINFNDNGIPCSVTMYSINFNKYKLKITTICGIFIGFIPIYMFYNKLFEGQLSAIFLGVLICAYLAACGQDFKDLINNDVIKQRKLSEFGYD